MKKVIDISDYSENLDWDAIAANEDGVIIKISEGRTPSSMFEEHLGNVLEKGLEWGVYCLSHAQTTERAEQEAQKVIELLNGYGAPPLYIWFDMEPEMAEMVDAEDLTAIASAFVSECNANGFDCGIYGNYSTLNKLYTDWLAEYVPYWSAEPGSYECDFKTDHPELNVKMWQYEFDNTDYDGVVDKNEWWES